MDILRRFLTQTLRENTEELQRSEMLKRQRHMIQYDNWQAMKTGTEAGLMPSRPFNSNGQRPTGRIRIRTSWFGFAVFEEEREYIDGTRVWARVPGYRILSE
ncbi:hypothetical protein [Microvirga mediterraneensis]|uniref:Uncharacterized protein n=1 Tax=Microvirga mediterraneensis TaxID=2754695 RepID=A0A838BPV3_9HYPH|nr:hypothetical protein [Microvirga mediterraneensis]MBA1157774.1 hypothetical protein [Microvirga mediterraneensis]